jgi:hypothetical protein
MLKLSLTIMRTMNVMHTVHGIGKAFNKRETVDCRKTQQKGLTMLRYHSFGTLQRNDERSSAQEWIDVNIDP